MHAFTALAIIVEDDEIRLFIAWKERLAAELHFALNRLSWEIVVGALNDSHFPQENVVNAGSGLFNCGADNARLIRNTVNSVLGTLATAVDVRFPIGTVA